MLPTLRPGDRVLVSRLGWPGCRLRRGDIVLIRSPGPLMRAEIKRLVAMPGDRVLLDGSGLYLNGERMPEPYVKQQYSTPGSYAWGLGRDEYLALGDNRDESHDSRHFGPVSGSDLRGRVWYRYGPRDPGFLGGLETRGTID